MSIKQNYQVRFEVCSLPSASFACMCHFVRPERKKPVCRKQNSRFRHLCISPFFFCSVSTSSYRRSSELCAGRKSQFVEHHWRIRKLNHDKTKTEFSVSPMLQRHHFHSLVACIQCLGHTIYRTGVTRQINGKLKFAFVIVCRPGLQQNLILEMQLSLHEWVDNS